jgi:hypothetical protein
MSFIKNVISDDGRVVLVEAVITNKGQHDLGKLLDIEMLVSPGGKEKDSDGVQGTVCEGGSEDDADCADEIAVQRYRSSEGCLIDSVGPLLRRRCRRGIGVGQDAPASPLSPLRSRRDECFLLTDNYLKTVLTVHRICHWSLPFTIFHFLFV